MSKEPLRLHLTLYTHLHLECVCFWGNFCDCDLKKISFKKIWLVGFRYVFGWNYSWNLGAAKNMYKMFGSCVIAVAFQSAFYLNIH